MAIYCNKPSKLNTRDEIMRSAKPILFNTEMVQAILEGRKTVTRRVVKPKHKGASGIRNMGGAIYDVIPVDFIDGEIKIGEYQKPPYAAGDYLYVRETWSEWTGGYLYKAWTGPFHQPGKSRIMRWYPSIHMPKEAARLFLKVTDVRVERLQECEKGWCLDIEREGVVTPQSPILYVNDDKYHEALREEFYKLWNSTIKKANLDKYGWDANPWVWVIEFERVEV